MSSILAGRRSPSAPDTELRVVSGSGSVTGGVAELVSRGLRRHLIAAPLAVFSSSLGADASKVVGVPEDAAAIAALPSNLPRGAPLLGGLGRRAKKAPRQSAAALYVSAGQEAGHRVRQRRRRGRTCWTTADEGLPSRALEASSSVAPPGRVVVGGRAHGAVPAVPGPTDASSAPFFGPLRHRWGLHEPRSRSSGRRGSATSLWWRPGISEALIVRRARASSVRDPPRSWVQLLREPDAKPLGLWRWLFARSILLNGVAPRPVPRLARMAIRWGRLRSTARDNGGGGLAASGGHARRDHIHPARRRAAWCCC